MRILICVQPRNRWLFLDALKVVVEHSSMTNQTHLFRQLNVGRPDQGATPRTNNVVPEVFYTTFIQFDLP